MNLCYFMDIQIFFFKWSLLGLIWLDSKPNITMPTIASIFSKASVLTWCSVPVILLWSAMAERKIRADMNTDGHIKRINKIKTFRFLWQPNGHSKPLGDIAVGCVSYTHPMRRRIARQGETAKRGKQFTQPVLSHLRKCRRVWLRRGDLVFCYELQSGTDSSACNSLQTHWHCPFIWILPCYSS